MKSLFLTISFTLATLFSIAQGNVKSKSNEEKLNDEYATGIFQTSQGTIIDMTSASVGGYLNILDFLEGRVAGFKVYTSRNQNKIPLIRGQQVAIFVDEVQVSVGYLNALPVTDIALVKVIKTPFAASERNNPAIAIYRIKVTEEEEGE